MTARTAAGILLIGFVSWFVLISETPSAPPTPTGVELKTIKYRDLLRAVRAERGKVVLIDVWGEF